MNLIKKSPRIAVLLTVFLLNIIIWSAVSSSSNGGLLKIYALDIGQGDSFLIESPSGKLLLIDGGRNKKVLTELGEVLSFFKKNIDVIIATHPDQDHIGGLASVIEKYKTGLFIDSGVNCDKALCEEINKDLVLDNSKHLVARRGTVIDFGDGVYLTILFPDRDVSEVETNTGSVVARLTFGQTSAIFTGDSPKAIEDFLVLKDGNNLKSTILKAGHHGSKTSSDPIFVQTVSPEISIISAGKDNSYGHPHKETLDTLNAVGSKIYSTIDSGRLLFESDGRAMVFSP